MPMKREATNSPTGWAAVAIHYGLDHQLIKLAEEVGELIHADHLRVRDVVPFDAVVEEIADVTAVADQVAYLLGDRTGELKDMTERARPSEQVNPLVYYGTAVITAACRAANSDRYTSRATLFVPLSNLLASLETYCTEAGCVRQLRAIRSQKLQRQKERIRKEKQHGTEISHTVRR